MSNKLAKIGSVVAASAMAHLASAFYLWQDYVELGPPSTSLSIQGPYHIMGATPNQPQYLKVGCPQAIALVNQLAQQYSYLNWGFGIGDTTPTGNNGYPAGSLFGYVFLDNWHIIGQGPPLAVWEGQAYVARYSLNGDPQRRMGNIQWYGQNTVPDGNLRWIVRMVPTSRYGAPAGTPTILSNQIAHGSPDDGYPFYFSLGEDGSYTDGNDYRLGNNNPLYYNKFLGVSAAIPALPRQPFTTYKIDSFLCAYYNYGTYATVTVLDGFELGMDTVGYGVPIPVVSFQQVP